DREERGRGLIGHRIGLEAGRKRRANPADDRPMVEALDEGNRSHQPQKGDEPIGPALSAGIAFGGDRLERPRLVAVHGSSSSRASGAKWRSTSVALTAASDGGCQRGAWSLSMITALIPS